MQVDSKTFLNKFKDDLHKTRKVLQEMEQDEKFDQDDIFEIIDQVDHLYDTLKEILKKCQ